MKPKIGTETFKGIPSKTPAAALIALLAAFTPLHSNADVQWHLAPYLWASDVGLDLKVDNDPVLGTDIAFDSLIDKVDVAFMGHIEAYGEKFGALADIIYLDLGDQATVNVGPREPVSGDLEFDTDMKMSLYELGGFYRIGSASAGTAELDILFGARLIDLEQSIKISLPGPRETEIETGIDVSETDVFVGAQVVGKFNERWSYHARADIGGGGTDGTVNALAAIGYTFGDTGLFTLDMGYRYMAIEMSDENGGFETEIEVELSGPFLGFVFNF